MLDIEGSFSCPPVQSMVMTNDIFKTYEFLTFDQTPPENSFYAEMYTC